MKKTGVLAVAAILALGSRASFGLDDVQNFLAQGADGAVVLSWENPAGADYAGVVIRRSTTGYPADMNDGEPVGPFPTGDFPVSQTSYVDDGLANGITYYYAAFAHDNLMNPAAGVTASASTAQAVTNFQATSGEYEIALSWNMPTDATPNFVGVVIRRSTDAYPQTVAEGDLLVTVAAQPDPTDYASYVDTDVVPLTVYYYSAFAHYYFASPADVDAYGPPMSVDETATGLTDVGNFQAYGIDTRVELSWENPGGTQYVGVRILRSEVDFPPIYNSHVSDPANVDLVGDFDNPMAQFTDLGLTVGVIYYYTAFAYNGDMPPVYMDGVTAFAAPLQGVTIDDTDTQSQQVILFLTAPTAAVTTFQDLIVRRSETAFPATETDGDDAGMMAPQATSSYAFVDGGLVNDMPYYYSVFAHYFLPAFGMDAYTVPAQVVVIPGDRDPPAEVANFSVTSGEDRQVTISWDTPTDDWARVEIRRSTDIATVSNGAVVFTQPNDGWTLPTCVDAGVINGQTYWYAAIAVDDAGNESQFTAISATPVDITPPFPPELTVRPWIFWAGYPEAVVEITLTAPADPDLEEVVLLRGPSPGPRSTDEEGVIEIDFGSPGFPFYDEDVVLGQTYYYAAWAVDDDGNISGVVDAGPVTPVDNFPPVFLTVTATPSGPPHEAVLDWTIQELEPTNYEVAYGTTLGCHLGSIGDDSLVLSNTRTDTITDLWGGTTFYFRITMTDSKGAWNTYEDSFDTTLDSAEDTDGDGMADDWEIEQFGDTITSDGSGDADDLAAYADDMLNYIPFTDLDEYRYGTDPALFDTDGGGVDDRQEIANGSDPLNRPPIPLGPGKGCGAAPRGASLAAALAALACALAARKRARSVR